MKRTTTFTIKNDTGYIKTKDDITYFEISAFLSKSHVENDNIKTKDDISYFEISAFFSKVSCRDMNAVSP